MIDKTKESRRRHLAFERPCVWIVFVAATLGGMRWAGVDAIFCAVYIAWGMTVAITREYLGVRAGGIVSGSIAATGVGWAYYVQTVSIHPARPMEGVVIAIPAAFALGYGLSLVIGALFTQGAKWVGSVLHRAVEVS